MVFLVISFIAGLLTVLAPCVLPLLPVVIGGSLAGEEVNRKKALTIVIALGISVILFTFILKVSTAFIAIPESLWMWISGTILILFGLITLFPSLWDNLKFAARINQKSNKILGVGYQKKSFWGDIIIGASLGPVFSSCSPTYFIVLATVLPASL
ncbi:MAG: cytochrome c biogenesis protein CcdA, partial [Candidatus Pacebacteria bacterium]|nr:cytochrome c biogenesis protein CcdA [Candidatus Paceibacterota bacterium]